MKRRISLTLAVAALTFAAVVANITNTGGTTVFAQSTPPPLCDPTVSKCPPGGPNDVTARPLAAPTLLQRFKISKKH